MTSKCLAKSIHYILLYKFRILVYHVLGLFFVPEEQRRKMFYCYYFFLGLYLEFYIFGYLHLLPGFSALIFNSSWLCRYTMTDLERMDCLATGRLLYCLFQICLNVSLHWMHGGTSGLLIRGLLQRERGNFHWKKRSAVILFVTLVSSVSLMLRFFVPKKKKKKSCSNKCRDRNSKLCAHMDGQADILRLSADQITACETIQSCTLSIMLEFVLFVINNVLKKNN
jgi:hypothetical protein